MKLNIPTANERSVLFEQELNAIFVINFKLGVILQKVLGNLESYLGVFAKLRKTTISFVVSVCPSVRPHGTTLFLLDGFS
jgi:hypothetical protein